MSLSYLNHRAGLARACSLAVGLLSVSVLGSASAARFDFVPQIEVGAEHNTNLLVEPGDSDSSQGYLADLSALFSITSPRWSTTVIPHLHYQEYPDFEEVSSVEGDLDFLSRYKSERSSFSVGGRYEQRDELSAELPDAQFDQLNPNLENSPDAGRVRVGATRQMAVINPAYNYDVSERIGLGLSSLYQIVEYDPTDAGYNDFDYYQAELAISRAFSRRVRLSMRPYVARFDAKDIDSQTDVIGTALGAEMRWSETLTGGLRISYERNDIQETFAGSGGTLVRVDEKVNAWGATFDLTRRMQASSLLLSIGRRITPSGAGGMYRTDEIQVQYDKELSQRLTAVAAVLLMRDESLSGDNAISEGDYAVTNFDLQWLISRTWYVRAGYAFIWQESKEDSASAKNHRLTLSFGYRGLDPAGR